MISDELQDTLLSSHLVFACKHEQTLTLHQGVHLIEVSIKRESTVFNKSPLRKPRIYTKEMIVFALTGT